MIQSTLLTVLPTSIISGAQLPISYLELHFCDSLSLLQSHSLWTYVQNTCSKLQFYIFKNHQLPWS